MRDILGMTDLKSRSRKNTTHAGASPAASTNQKLNNHETDNHNRGFGASPCRALRESEAHRGRHRGSAKKAHAYHEEGTQTDTEQPKEKER